jgi:hypothetical protein
MKFNVRHPLVFGVILAGVSAIVASIAEAVSGDHSIDPLRRALWGFVFGFVFCFVKYTVLKIDDRPRRRGDEQ